MLIPALRRSSLKVTNVTSSPPASGRWNASAEHAGLTVSRVLRTFVADTSWSQIKRLIAGRRVAVNGLLCLDESRRLNAGDEIVLAETPLPQPPSDADVRVLHLDESVVVIDKPSGMMSLRHVAEIDWPARKRALQPSADEVVLRAVGRFQRGRDDLSALPPKLRRKHVRSVHRLDRDTSGLLLFARTVEAEQHLVRQFSQHSITRAYVAIAFGSPPDGTVRNRLVRDRGDGLRGSTSLEDAGKPAATQIRTNDSLGDYSVMECELETGRTHQIRIHLAEQGHPVCGDRVYRGPINGPLTGDDSNAPRLALHARLLEFEHPTSGERLRFESDLPDDLSAFVERLRTQ